MLIQAEVPNGFVGEVTRARVGARVRRAPAWGGARSHMRDVGEQTILVEKALALGEVRDTKTRRTRTVRLLRPLAADLAEWRMASGRPGERELIFPMLRGGP